MLDIEAIAGAAMASALSSEMTRTVRRRRIWDLLCVARLLLSIATMRQSRL